MGTWEGVEVDQSRRVEDRRVVSVKVPLQAPLHGDRDVTVYVTSSRLNEGEWSPPIVRLDSSGQSVFQIYDWAAIREGIDRAIAAFRVLEA
jgi:hypothetical protein